MRFLVYLFCILLFTQTSSWAIEEVILDVDDNVIQDEVGGNVRENCREKINSDKELTLYEKIQNIKVKEISDTSRSSFLLDEILTKEFDNGATMHLFGYYRAGAEIDVSDDGNTDYNFSAIHAGINGKFKGGKNFYEARLRFDPLDGYTFLQTLPADIYVANTSIPHHKIILGNTRTPVGFEGGRSDMVMPFVARAQIARNFGNSRKVGLRIKGNYDLVEYDIGGYSSDTYFRSFFPGTEFSGWLTLKPLGKTDGRYGKLKLGGGLSAGRNNISYAVSGVYAGYEYKNFFADFEYSYADGYNGAKRISSNQAEGFYSTVGYKITPKLQFVTRYDQFTPDRNKSNDIRREYSTGINYFIKGQALKIMLNYVFCQNDLFKDSHRIILGTQLIL